MEVELHDVSPAHRPAMKERLQNYRKELARLRKEFVRHVLSDTVVHVFFYSVLVLALLPSELLCDL